MSLPLIMNYSWMLKMACLPGSPQNLVRKVDKVKDWAPGLTQVEKGWLPPHRRWLQTEPLTEHCIQRRPGAYKLVLNFNKGLSQLFSSGHNCTTWQSTANGGEETAERGGGRHRVWGQWLQFRGRTLFEIQLWDLEPRQLLIGFFQAFVVYRHS